MSQSDPIEWWVSSEKMTIFVRTDQWRMILECAPISKKFIGQPLANLTKWLGKSGAVRVERLTPVFNCAKSESRNTVSKNTVP